MGKTDFFEMVEESADSEVRFEYFLTVLGVLREHVQRH